MRVGKQQGFSRVKFRLGLRIYGRFALWMFCTQHVLPSGHLDCVFGVWKTDSELVRIYASCYYWHMLQWDRLQCTCWLQWHRHRVQENTHFWIWFLSDLYVKPARSYVSWAYEVTCLMAISVARTTQLTDVHLHLQHATKRSIHTFMYCFKFLQICQFPLLHRNEHFQQNENSQDVFTF